MERSHLKAGSLVELEFVTDRECGIHWHENIELLFVVSGELKLTVEEDTYTLQNGGLALVNVNRKHSYQGSEGLVLARFLISYSKVRELLGVDYALFWCNSAADQNEGYEELRRVIFRILNRTIGNDSRNQLFFSSMYYQMLHILAENFTLAPSDERYKADADSEDDRMQQIFNYIRTNYQQSISLNDIADYLYLSPTYVSKYIKQKCGINLIQLLNSVRLTHAMEDLMYSDDPIIKIALENGFASVAAYNKAFKESYHQTPSEFRKKHRCDEESRGQEMLKKQALVEQKIRAVLDRTPVHEGSDTVVRLDIAADLRCPPEHIWNHNSIRMINIGTATDLLNAEVQKQILNSRAMMSFEYVRFWDIYDPKLYLDIHAPRKKQNYSRINAVTDFLVQNHLKPYIELGFKSRRIIRTTTKVIHHTEREDTFQNDAEMAQFYHDLFRHFIKRYGSWEVGSWYFEYWEKPACEDDSAGTLQYAKISDEQHRSYFRQFDLVAGSLRAQLPGAHIGGAGFPVRVYGQEAFAQLLTQWTQAEQQPDFVTLSCYPYQQEKVSGAYYEKRSSDMNFVRYGIELAENAMKEAGFPAVPILVTEYNLTLSSRNALNDSCLKAAYLMNNAIDCIDRAELLGHYVFSDYFAEERDTGTVLFGGNGLLTKDGIAKPAFYAMEFLNMLYPTVLQKGKNYLITRNPRGSLRMVCHNLKKPNFSYYQAEEDALEIQALPSILSDREFLRMTVRFSGLSEGTYLVKTSLLNSHHGSVQDKWMDMNMESNLTPKEMNYLRMSSHSDLSIRRYESENGVLELEWEMEPNEIRYLHIFRT